MPVAARELDGVSLYAFAFSGYFTTSLFGMVLAGQWSDRQGPLGPLTAGIAAFAAGLLVAGTAGAMWLFIAGPGRAGTRRRAGDRRAVRRRRPRLSGAAAARDHGRVRGQLGGALGGRAARRRRGHRASRLALGLPRHPGAGGPPLALALPPIRRLAGGPGRKRGRRARLSTGAGSGSPSRSRSAPGCCSTPARICGGSRCFPAPPGVALLVPAVLGLLPRGTYRAARGLPSVVLLRGVAAGSFIAAESFVPLMLVTQRGLSPTHGRVSRSPPAAGPGRWARTCSPGRGWSRTGSG